MKRHTTNEAASRIGIHRVTLQRWIASNKIPAPKVRKVGVLSFRLWTSLDIERAKKAIQRREAKR